MMGYQSQLTNGDFCVCMCTVYLCVCVCVYVCVCVQRYVHVLYRCVLLSGTTCVPVCVRIQCPCMQFNSLFSGYC